MKSFLVLALLLATVLGVFSKPEIEDEDGSMKALDKGQKLQELSKRRWRYCWHQSHCSPGYYCASNYYCYRYPKCKVHSQCFHNWYCDMAQRVCKPGKRRCSTDNQCGPGYKCTNGVCSRFYCYKNKDCPNGHFCYSYSCHVWDCRRYRCAWGMFCHEGRCKYRECNTQGGRKCKPDEQCVHPGLCRPRPTPSTPYPTKPTQPTEGPTTEEPGSGLGEVEV